MKFLCICYYGHSRSAAMVRCLHGHKHEAVCAGYGTSPSVLSILTEWTDRVIVMDGGFRVTYPIREGAEEKFMSFPIGPDKWSNPYHPELAALCEKWYKENLE